MAAWTTAMSRKLTGTGRGGAAFDTVSAAMAFQSSTASARATCHQLTAANTITWTVVTPFSHLFERMRDMGSSLSGRGVTLPRRFCVQVRTTSLTICYDRAYPFNWNSSDACPDRGTRAIRATTYAAIFTAGTDIAIMSSSAGLAVT